MEDLPPLSDSTLPQATSFLPSLAKKVPKAFPKLTFHYFLVLALKAISRRMWFWINQVISLSLRFLFCEMGTTNPTHALPLSELQEVAWKKTFYKEGATQVTAKQATGLDHKGDDSIPLNTEVIPGSRIWKRGRGIQWVLEFASHWEWLFPSRIKAGSSWFGGRGLITMPPAPLLLYFSPPGWSTSFPKEGGSGRSRGWGNADASWHLSSEAPWNSLICLFTVSPKRM